MKKALSLILVLVMALSLFAGCAPADNTTTTAGGNNEKPLQGTYDIKVWVADDHADLTKELIDKFNSTNEYGITINATIDPVGEGDVSANMTTDVAVGADLFTFPQDQTAVLVEAGALDALNTEAQTTVSAANASGVVSAATLGSKMYAYPMTADNGYFMYYDKSVIKESSVGSLEALIADCEAAGRNFNMQLEGSGWYTASFFFGAGCVSNWGTNSDGKFDSFNDTWKSDLGVIAAKGMQKLLTSSCYINSDKGVQEFDSAIKAAVVMSGTWDYETAKGILGDNMGVAKLPTFEVDGKTYQMGSFNGCKLIGVKPQSDAKKSAALHLLAQYLTNEESQMARFNALSWGPSNLNAQKNEAVLANPGLAALLAQSPYSVPQGQIPADWWTTAQTLATAIKEAKSDDDINAALQVYYDKLLLMANPATQLDADQWTVIGIGGKWNSGDDKLMTKQDDGTWKSNEAFELKAGDQFKIRRAGKWDNGEFGNGTENYTVAEDGTYYIVADVENKTITLVKA